MWKYVFILLSFLLLTSSVFAQSKVTDLTEITDPVSTDILYIVDDPSGTAVSRKTTVGNVGKGIASTSLTDTSDILYESELDSESELEAQIADMTNIIQATEIDTFAEINAIVADETLVNTDDAQTLTNKTMTFGGNTITMTEAQLETAVTDDNPIFDGDIGTSVQAYDADLADLADGSLTASKVAGVADADYGDVSVSGGVWSVDSGVMGLTELSDVGTTTPTAGNILVGDNTNFDSVAVSGDATLSSAGALTIQANAIEESMLKAVDSASDEECLTYEMTTGDFEWQACGGGASALGDLSDVTITGAAEGDIIYYNGSAWVDLTRGSNGQVLKSTSTTIEWGMDATGAGGGVTTIKSDNAQVGDADIQIIDFASPFTVSESPDQEINVGLSMGLSELTDVGTTTPTSGSLLIANGSQFATQVMSGDATINSTGVISLSADVVSTAEMDDADFGDWTCSGGSCTVDNNVIDGANIALGGDAQGDVMFYNGTDWANLAAGTSGYVLSTQGAGANPVWAEVTGWLNNLVDDASPQLGGNLDVNGNSIVSVSDGNIIINPDGTGTTRLSDLTNCDTIDTDADGDLACGTDADTNTNASTECSGTTTYYDGEGNCDDISSVYLSAAGNAVDGTDIALGSDAQGDVMFYNGTDWAGLAAGTSGYFLKTNGAAANPQWSTIPEEWSFAYTSPTDGDLIIFYKAPYALTISDVDCIVDPADSSESVVIDIQECDSTGDSCVTIDATITCDNDGAADDGALSNGLIDSGDWVALDVGTVTGTVSVLSATIRYTKD